MWRPAPSACAARPWPPPNCTSARASLWPGAISAEESAGAVQLLDRGAAQRSAGIVSENASGEGQPLLSDVYYLERALSPYAEIAKGGIAQLLDKQVSVLLLADVA